MPKRTGSRQPIIKELIYAIKRELREMQTQYRALQKVVCDQLDRSAIVDNQTQVTLRELQNIKTAPARNIQIETQHVLEVVKQNLTQALAENAKLLEAKIQEVVKANELNPPNWNPNWEDDEGEYD